MERPLILVTNDDGIRSEGLWAAAEVLLPLGELLVVAPDRQWSGAGRSMPPGLSGNVMPFNRRLNGEWVNAYAVDATPALAVVHGVLELASRRPALVVSGINFGENLGIEVTISGTVGAALEAGAFGIPSLAVSLEMAPAYHLTGDAYADYAAAQAVTQRFACRLLETGLAWDIDVLNINVPADATPDTPWRLARLSRHRYYMPLPPDRTNGPGRPGYRLIENPERTELGSDIMTVKVARAISVTPLSLDLTSRVSFNGAAAQLGNEAVSDSSESVSYLYVDPDFEVEPIPDLLDDLAG